MIFERRQSDSWWKPKTVVCAGAEELRFGIQHIFGDI